MAYLDTDVGQPEFTTPGCLSLHVIHEQTPGMIVFLFTVLVMFGSTGKLMTKSETFGALIRALG